MSWWGTPSTAPTVVLGTRGHGVFKRPLPLPLGRFRTHIRVTGKSGFGKSNALASLYLSLLEQGAAITLLDPHGTLARCILHHLVAHGFFRRPDAFDKLRFLDIPAAARQNRYVPMNILQQPTSPYTTARGIQEATHRAYPELKDGAATFNTLIKNAVKVLISNRARLTDLHRFLTDKPFRDRLLLAETDPEIVRVFTGWYDRFSLREQAAEARSLLNRANDLTFSSLLKHSLGGDRNLIDFADVYARGVSSLISLNLESPEEARLFGCLLTVFAEFAAIARTEDQRRSGPHYLMIDEFSLFSARSSDALDTLFSQSRKRDVFVIVCYQNASQIRERTHGGMQNIGMDIMMRSGRDDAEERAHGMGLVDPLAVKHEVEDEQAEKRTHPSFYSLSEQAELLTQRFQGLWRGEACVVFDNPSPPRFPRSLWTRALPRTVLWLNTMPMEPPPHVDPGELAAVEDEYLRRYFEAPATDEARQRDGSGAGDVSRVQLFRRERV